MPETPTAENQLGIRKGQNILIKTIKNQYNYCRCEASLMICQSIEQSLLSSVVVKLASVFSKSRVADEENGVNEKHDCDDGDHNIAENEELGAHPADESEENDSAGDGVEEAEVLGHASGDYREADFKAADQNGEGEDVAANENSAPSITATAAAIRCS